MDLGVESLGFKGLGFRAAYLLLARNEGMDPH